MVTVAELDKWDPNALVQLLGVMFGKHKRLTNLGDTLDGMKRSLEGWGGEAADAWRLEVGKRRTDIDEQQKQTRAVTDALEPVVDEVGHIVTDYKLLKDEIAKRGWKITSEGKIVGDIHGDLNLETLKNNKENELKQLLERATAIDDDIAAAIRRSVSPTDTPTDPKKQPDKNDPTILASAPVAGPDGNPPYGNGAKPTMIPGATIPMSDNPPGIDPGMGPGPQRDQAWKDYLNNVDGSRKKGEPPAFLPKPEAVQDKSLRVIGAAGRQQGVSYAWGGNRDVNGPSPGHKATPQEYPGYTQQELEQDGSWTNNDDRRIGYDCGGLVRFSYHEGAGIDVGQGTNAIDSNTNLHRVQGGVRGELVGNYAQPGDIFVYGNTGHTEFTNGGTHHTGIYLGNGVIINAPESGKPINTAPVTNWTGQPTDILRLP